MATKPQPQAGWVRTLRETLGMSLAQLALRLGLTRQGVAELEIREREQTITLAALRKAADAMDADLVYALVPRKPLGTIVRDQARLAAIEYFKRVTHSMRLEDQGVPGTEVDAQVRALQEKLLSDWPRRMWDAGTRRRKK